MSKCCIPYDLIYCILARSYVKDLIKWKCLSKLWMSTIESPQFIKFHIINHSFNPKSQKLIFSNWRFHSHRCSVTGFLTLPDKIYGDYSSTGSGFLTFSEIFHGDQKSKFPKEISCSRQFYEKKNIVGTLRGILCIQYTKGNGVYLYNPWIREHRKVPSCQFSLSKHTHWFYHVYGFGYDELNDDFKVVKLGRVRNKTQPVITNEGKIYSLKSNKWKSIENIPIYFIKYDYGFLFNHSLHWLFSNHIESFLSVYIIT